MKKSQVSIWLWTTAHFFIIFIRICVGGATLLITHLQSNKSITWSHNGHRTRQLSTLYFLQKTDGAHGMVNIRRALALPY